MDTLGESLNLMSPIIHLKICFIQEQNVLQMESPLSSHAGYQSEQLLLDTVILSHLYLSAILKTILFSLDRWEVKQLTLHSQLSRSTH